MTLQQQAEEIIRRVAETFTDRFPDRIRACYLIGSYADGTAVALSDIDLIIIFKDQFRDADEKHAADTVAQECAAQSPIRLDITPRGENEIGTMYPVIRVGLVMGSVLVYGEDIRDRIAPPSPEEYTQDVIAGAMFFIARLNDVDKIVTLPLEYPNACDEFYGYTQKRFAEWYPTEVNAGTKELVATVSRIATATVAYRAGRYVSSKGEAARMYADLMGEPWGTFVTEVMQRCKHDWGYQIPENAFERMELAELCRQMRRFQNEFCQMVGSVAEVGPS